MIAFDQWSEKVELRKQLSQLLSGQSCEPETKTTKADPFSWRMDSSNIGSAGTPLLLEHEETLTTDL